jgi:hypothetical protein
LAQSQNITLHLPAWRQIREARDANAAGQGSPNGRFDDVGRQKCQRHRHVNGSPTAIFSGCDFVSVLHLAAGELLEPQATKSYRAFGELKVALSQNPIMGPGGPPNFCSPAIANENLSREP